MDGTATSFGVRRFLDSTIFLYNTTGLVNSTNLFAINFVNLPEGAYYLNATANDTVGNKNKTETREIQFDYTAPIITLLGPTNGASTTSKNILRFLSHCT